MIEFLKLIGSVPWVLLMAFLVIYAIAPTSAIVINGVENRLGIAGRIITILFTVFIYYIINAILS